MEDLNLPPKSDGLTPPQRARQRYLKRANIPIVPKAIPYEDLPKEVREQTNVFVEACLAGGGDLPGVGLVLWGPPGTGKTTVAKSVLTKVLEEAPRDWLGRAEYDAYRPGYFIPHTEFISTHHDSWRDDEDADEARDLIKSLYCRHTRLTYRNTRLLALDDVGKENPNVGTGHKQQVFHDIIRIRYGKGCPTIITTNYRNNEWKGKYGPATASFLNEAFLRVNLDGADRRG